MKIRIPRKFVFCRTGVLLLIVAHVLLFLGELIAHHPRHHHCKLIGYGLVLGVLLFRTLKAGWQVETPHHSQQKAARESKKNSSRVVMPHPKHPSPPQLESGAARAQSRQGSGLATGTAPPALPSSDSVQSGALPAGILGPPFSLPINV